MSDPNITCYITCCITGICDRTPPLRLLHSNMFKLYNMTQPSRCHGSLRPGLDALRASDGSAVSVSRLVWRAGDRDHPPTRIGTPQARGPGFDLKPSRSESRSRWAQAPGPQSGPGRMPLRTSLKPVYVPHMIAVLSECAAAGSSHRTLHCM
jgi:hypothetical protein